MVQIRIPNVLKRYILSFAPTVSFKRKILEAYFIRTVNPILNNQLNSDILTLFGNGVT